MKANRLRNLTAPYPEQVLHPLDLPLGPDLASALRVFLRVSREERPVLQGESLRALQEALLPHPQEDWFLVLSV